MDRFGATQGNLPAAEIQTFQVLIPYPLGAKTEGKIGRRGDHLSFRLTDSLEPDCRLCHKHFRTNQRQGGTGHDTPKQNSYQAHVVVKGQPAHTMGLFLGNLAELQTENRLRIRQHTFLGHGHRFRISGRTGAELNERQIIRRTGISFLRDGLLFLQSRHMDDSQGQPCTLNRFMQQGPDQLVRQNSYGPDGLQHSTGGFFPLINPRHANRWVKGYGNATGKQDAKERMDKISMGRQHDCHHITLLKTRAPEEMSDPPRSVQKAAIAMLFAVSGPTIEPDPGFILLATKSENGIKSVQFPHLRHFAPSVFESA